MTPDRDLPATEEVNPASAGLDELDAAGILAVIHREDRRAWEAVGAALGPLAELVEATADRLRRGGRLAYFGAGTSGRLGVLDASECPPTFGVEPDLVQARIAGGDTALRVAVEGAEDSPEAGRRDVAGLGLGGGDVACGIAASGATPYVLGALEEARSRGALTALLCCNPRRRERGAPAPADHCIVLDTGAEVIAGSTRMKAGTATKMALNALSSAVMVRLGKVHDNLMVDLRASNRKLTERAVRLVRRLGGVDEERARSLLEAAGEEVKPAVVMARRGVGPDRARALLVAGGGRLREALRRADETAGGS